MTLEKWQIQIAATMGIIRNSWNKYENTIADTTTN